MLKRIAILISGGIDSAVLCAELASSYSSVYPLYIRSGMVWEGSEFTHLQRFLNELSDPVIRSVTTLDMPVSDIYHNHWSTSGNAIPDHDTEDDAVYLPGRNILLLAKAGIWCDLNSVSEIAMAPLKGNPFSDNTFEFYKTMANVLTLALGHNLEIKRPYDRLTKADVIHRGKNLPLHLTFSCINPQADQHCGQCNKCSERKRAFVEAHATDTTSYALCDIV